MDIKITDAIVASVRSGADVFVDLQRSRLSSNTVAGCRRTRSEQSLVLFNRLSTLGDSMDVMTKELWDLTTLLLRAMEEPFDSVDGSQLYLQWYQDHYVDAVRLSRGWTVLSSDESLENADNIEGLWAPYLTTALRAFLAGFFPQTANFVDAALRYLRTTVSDCFTAEEEVCFSHVVRLLGAPPQSEVELQLWQRDASHCIGDARYSFQLKGAECEAVQRVKQLSLDFLLMMSGDMPLIREHCTTLELSPLDFSAAIIALVRPFATLQSVHQLLATTCSQWKTSKLWHTDVVVRLFGSREAYDFVNCMEEVAQIAQEQPWDDLEEEQQELRIFCLTFMAFHITDVAIDSTLLSVPHTQLHFVRNELLVLYVRLFAHHSALWRTAATYVAFAPLINPVYVRETILTAGGVAILDDRKAENLEMFVRQYFDSGSAFQRLLRAHLRKIVEGSKSLELWIDAFDAAVGESIRLLHGKSIAKKWNRQSFVTSVWEAVETSLTTAVEHRIAHMLREPLTVESIDVLSAVGEAVQCGHIALDRARPVTLATLLRLLSSFTMIFSQRGFTSTKPQFVCAASPGARLNAVANILDHAGEKLLHSSTVVQLCETVIDLVSSAVVDDDVTHALVKVNTALGRLFVQTAAPHGLYDNSSVDVPRLRGLQRRITALLLTV